MSITKWVFLASLACCSQVYMHKLLATEHGCTCPQVLATDSNNAVNNCFDNSYQTSGCNGGCNACNTDLQGCDHIGAINTIFNAQSSGGFPQSFTYVTNYSGISNCEPVANSSSPGNTITLNGGQISQILDFQLQYGFPIDTANTVQVLQTTDNPNNYPIFNFLSGGTYTFSPSIIVQDSVIWLGGGDSNATLTFSGVAIDVGGGSYQTGGNILRLEAGFDGATVTLNYGPGATNSSVDYPDNYTDAINLVSEGTLCNIVNTSNQTVFLNGVISGSGGAAFGGNLNLGAVSTYTGSTTIGTSSQVSTTVVNTGAQIGSSSAPITIDSGSTLTVNGAIYTSILQQYGVLNGTGTVNGESIQSYEGSTTSGGNSPGTLSIVGNGVFHQGSTVLVSVNPVEASLLDFSGTVQLKPDVTLQIVPDVGCYNPSTNFSILVAEGGVTGTFTTVEVGSVLLQATPSYSATGVSLELSRQNLANIGFSGNAHQVAKAFDSMLNAGHAELCTLLGSMILASPGEIQLLLEDVQPSLYKGLAIAQENNNVKVRNSLSLRLQEELDSKHCQLVYSSSKDSKETPCNTKKHPWQVWMNGMGDALHQNNTHAAGSFQFGYQDNMGGATLGLDYHFADYCYAGVLGAYTSSHVKWNDHKATGNIQTGYAGLYFSAIGDMFYGNASVIGSWSHYKSSRYLSLPNEKLTAYNTHGGSGLLSHADTGINFGWGGFTLRPFDSFDYVSQTEQAYTESGAGFLDLSVNKNNNIMLRNELGLQFAYCLCHLGNKFLISPKISWVREVRVKGQTTTATFKDEDASFKVTGFFPDRSLVSPGISLSTLLFDERFAIELYYDGEFRGNYSDHSYGGELRFGF